MHIPVYELTIFTKRYLVHLQNYLAPSFEYLTASRNKKKLKFCRSALIIWWSVNMTENTFILDLIFCEFSEILLIKTWLDFNLPLVFRGQGVTRFLQRIPCGPWDHKRVVIRVQQLPGWTKESAGVPYSLPEKNYVHHPTVLWAFIWWVRFIIDYKYNYFVF